MSKTNYTISHGESLIDCEIEYDYSPGYNGSYYEPPEPPELVICGIVILSIDDESVSEQDQTLINNLIEKLETDDSRFCEMLNNRDEREYDE